MELTPGQRRAAFAAIVLALAGLGAFLLLPNLQRASGAPNPATSQRSTPAAAATYPASPPPGPSATPSAGTGPTPAVDIYRLLPFTQADLDQAVAVTQRFATAYGSYSYQQSAAAYAATMQGTAAPALLTTIERGFATPGVAAARTQQKQVVTATATVQGMRAFGPSSLTLLVQIVQATTATQGKSSLTTQYAVTVAKAGGGWQVSDIQLASAGNL